MGATRPESKSLKQEVDTWNDIEASFYRQKSKDHFYNDIDKNSKYFHIRANRRLSRNRIDALQDVNGGWCTDRKSLEELLTNHFKGISTSNQIEDCHTFLQYTPTCITATDNAELLRIPDQEEIYQCLRSMEPWTSPGPDGYPPGFYQSQWQVVKEDVCSMVQAFFHSGYILKELNNTRFSLIPKTETPSKPEEFRPIALCNTMYKLISKIITRRMRKHLEKIISPMQAAYVPGRRLISENITMVQEIVHSMRRKGGEGGTLALKMDMSKAFDRLEWSFIMEIVSLYDVNLVLRFLKLFLLGGDSWVPVTRMRKVANLIDLYMSEVAPDPSLRPSKFVALAIAVPDSGRDSYDGIYRAMDMYLEIHSRLIEEEKLKICCALNYEKLSSEACKHLAQNSKFPCRTTIQALVSQQRKHTKLQSNTEKENKDKLIEKEKEQVVVYAKSLNFATENEDLSQENTCKECSGE